MFVVVLFFDKLSSFNFVHLDIIIIICHQSPSSIAMVVVPHDALSTI